MKKLLGLFFVLSLVTNIYTQYNNCSGLANVTKNNMLEVYTRSGGTSCLKWFNIYTTPLTKVIIYKCGNKKYQKCKLFDTYQADNCGRIKTKHYSFNGGVHWLKFEAINKVGKAETKQFGLHIPKKCK